MHIFARTCHRTETVILVKAFSPQASQRSRQWGPRAGTRTPGWARPGTAVWAQAAACATCLQQPARSTAPFAQTGIPPFYKTHNKASREGKSLLHQCKVLLQEPGNSSGGCHPATRVFKRSSHFTDQTQKTSHLPCEKMTNASFRLFASPLKKLLNTVASVFTERNLLLKTKFKRLKETYKEMIKTKGKSELTAAAAAASSPPTQTEEAISITDKFVGASVVDDDLGRAGCVSWADLLLICGLPLGPSALPRLLCRLVPRFILGGTLICWRTRFRAVGWVETPSMSAQTLWLSKSTSGSRSACACWTSCGETDDLLRWCWKRCFKPWPITLMFSKALWVILDNFCSDSCCFLVSWSWDLPPGSGSSHNCSVPGGSIDDTQQVYLTIHI